MLTPVRFWECYMVPLEFMTSVCTCDEHPGKNTTEKRINDGHGNTRTLTFCRECGKLVRYHLLKCTTCHKNYLNTFFHSGWCPLSSRCYECCQEVPYICDPDSYCAKAHGYHRGFPVPPVSVPPLEGYGPKPVRSKEEVAADLDEFFATDDY